MIYFTSDTHFECPNLVANTRPLFATDEEHDDALIENINDTVLRTDTLIILGDFCKTRPGKFRQKINCRHIRYVMGNHDKPCKWAHVFGPLHDILKVKLGNGDYAFCTHYPMITWNRSHYGTYHFYGHLHADRELEWDQMFPERRSMDVGVDNAYRLLGHYRPFAWPEIQEILAGREGYGRIRPEDRWERRDFS